MSFANGNYYYGIWRAYCRLYSEADIACRFIGIDSIPAMICNPLRIDKNPSLSIYCSDSGRVYLRDFGNGNEYRLLEFLALLLGKTEEETVYYIVGSNSKYKEAIGTSCDYHYFGKAGLSKPQGPIKRIKKTYLGKVREWKSHDIEYWGKHGISKELAIWGDVYPISHLFIYSSDGSNRVIPADMYAYQYVEYKDYKTTVKIYQPFSKCFKWRSNHDSSVWDLWSKLPDKGDKLIITKSRKDALCLIGNTGIPATSLQGESYIPKESVVEELKGRFKSIFVLYDNDYDKSVNYGREYGKIICDKFNFKQIEIPTEYLSKDSSTLYMKHGKKVLIDVIDTLTY